MTPTNRTLSAVLAGLLVLSSVAAVSTASSAAGNVTANDSLVVGVQNAGNDGATVAVTHDGSAVPNASVTVGVADDDATYAGTGTYVTDASGEVSLPEPAENVTVEVAAAKGNLTGETTATLTTSGETEEDEEESFGETVSSFVHQLLNGEDDGDERSIGQAVSAFVTANNPGNASEKRPDHAGGPANAGPHNETAENETDDGDPRGPPEQPGNGNDGDDDRGNGDEKGNNGNGKGNGNGRSKGGGR